MRRVKACIFTFLSIYRTGRVGEAERQREAYCLRSEPHDYRETFGSNKARGPF